MHDQAAVWGTVQEASDEKPDFITEIVASTEEKKPPNYISAFEGLGPVQRSHKADIGQTSYG